MGPLGDLLGVDERVDIQNLSGPVDAVRDVNGRLHIYATSWTDAFRAQGYLVARDRTLHLEFLRRAAQGRLAAMFGHFDPSLVELDIAMRHVGLARVAQQTYELTAAEDRELLDAYADGVTQLFQRIRAGEQPLPAGITQLDLADFTDWAAVDSLTIARLLLWDLSYEAGEDIERQGLLDGMKAAFRADSENLQLQRRAGIERDVLRFAPPDPATTVDGPGGIGDGGAAYRSGTRQATSGEALRSAEDAAAPGAPGSGASPASLADRHPGGARLIARARGYLHALERARSLLGRRGVRGSNNWAISPGLSATGHALLANDPHLGLTAPSILWPVSMHVTQQPGRDTAGDLHAAGLAFPGIPVVILGHNQHLAWGATTAVHDVTDVYAETLTEDASAVVFQGQAVALETIEEVIDVKGGQSVTYPVKVVPHHGPIVPTIVDGAVQPLDAADGALSVRWKGMEPSTEVRAALGIMRARSVDEARDALGHWQVGAQNWMLADTSGDILWTSHAVVPVRDERALQWNPATYEGLLPCLVLPGDGTAEWTGAWDSEWVPWAKNPLAGYLATANNDLIGGTLDNDPSDDRLPDGSSAYLGCEFSMGFRQGRIQQLIQNQSRAFSLSDLSAIQNDARSSVGAALVPQLLLAIDNAQQEKRTPGSHPPLSEAVSDPRYDSGIMTEVRDALAAWRDEADYDAASGVDPDTNLPLGLEAPEARAAQATLLFNAWLVRMVARTLGDEMAHLGRERPSPHDVRALLHLFASDPATLATYDPVMQDSAIWDDMETGEIREGRQDRMIRAMLDALEDLVALLGEDRGAYRWGQLHTVQFEAIVPLYGKLSIPSAGDPAFGTTGSPTGSAGFPRHGDSFAVDACGFDLTRGLEEELDFTYDTGPVQRFVIDLDPSGPRARNALPGGAIWDAASPHFADEAELWRRNEVHDVPFALTAVLAAAEARIVATPGRTR